MSDNYTSEDKLYQTIVQVVELANKIGLSSLNESDTKSAIIEPVLEALGWNTRDPRIVKREYSTMAGKFADYALMIEKEPRLFIEAKDAGKNLYDDKWTAQVVSYANTEGIDWCVLTDGLAWRLFKSNEPVRVDEKLAFEINLTDVDDPNAHVLERLQVLSPASVSRGELHRFGTQVFIDSKVRAALVTILETKDQGLIKLIRRNLNVKVNPAEIRGSLTRILDGGFPESLMNTAQIAPSSEMVPHVELPSVPTQSQKEMLVPPEYSSAAEKAKRLSYAEKLDRWPPASQIHDALKSALVQSGAELTELKNIESVHINGNYSGALEAQRYGIKVRSVLSIASATLIAPSMAGRFTDCTGKGRWSGGITEVMIEDKSDVAVAVRLLTQTQ